MCYIITTMQSRSKSWFFGLPRIVALVAVAAFLLAVLAQSSHWHDDKSAKHRSDESHCTLCLHLTHLGDTASHGGFVNPPLASAPALAPFKVSAQSLNHSHSWFARGPPIV